MQFQVGWLVAGVSTDIATVPVNDAGIDLSKSLQVLRRGVVSVEFVLLGTCELADITVLLSGIPCS